MFNKQRIRKFAKLSLLAFLFNATMPFFASSVAQASLGLNTDFNSGKSLLCTVRGYSWVNTTQPKNSNVIVIKSPLALDQKTEKQSSDTTHCSLCFINPHFSETILSSATAQVPLLSIAHRKLTAYISNRFAEQHFLLIAPSRAPPHLA